MKMKFHQTRNDLREKTRGVMTDLLNQQLCDALDLGLQAKQAHWNVKGPNFIGLHELFDKVAEELEGFTDDIAERAVALEERRWGQFKSFRRNRVSLRIRWTWYPGRNTSWRCQALWQNLAPLRVAPLTSRPRLGTQTQPIYSPKFRAAWTNCCGSSKHTCRQRIESMRTSCLLPLIALLIGSLFTGCGKQPQLPSPAPPSVSVIQPSSARLSSGTNTPAGLNRPRASRSAPA
jgi:hypothetical protein